MFAQTNRNRLFFPLIVLTAWTGFGLFFGMQNYVRDVYFGKSASFGGYVAGWLLCGYSWAILTFPIILFVRRFTFAQYKWLRFFLIHIPTAVLFSIFQLAIYDAIAHLLFGSGGHDFVEYYRFLLANELQSSFLVYFALIGSIATYDHFFVNTKAAIGQETAVEELVPHTNGSGNGRIPVRRISVKENGHIVLLDVDEIDWITSEGNYLQLHTPKKKYLIRETMNSMESKLDGDEFVRLRRSTIVRIAQIKELHPTFNGEFEVVLKSGTKLSSSRRYRKNLEHLLKP